MCYAPRFPPPRCGSWGLCVLKEEGTCAFPLSHCVFYKGILGLCAPKEAAMCVLDLVLAFLFP